MSAENGGEKHGTKIRRHEQDVQEEPKEEKQQEKNKITARISGKAEIIGRTKAKRITR